MVTATAAATAASGQTFAHYKPPEPPSNQVICMAIDSPAPLNLCHIIKIAFVSGFIQWYNTGLCLCCMISVAMEAVKPQSLPVSSTYQSPGAKADLAAEGREHLDRETMTYSHI